MPRRRTPADPEAMLRLQDLANTINVTRQQMRDGAFGGDQLAQDPTGNMYGGHADPSLVGDVTYGFETPQQRALRLSGPRQAMTDPSQLARSGLGEPLSSKVSRSMQQFRMSTDPMAARWRTMLNQPAPAGPSEQEIIDKQTDDMRKMAMSRLQQIGNEKKYGQDPEVRAQKIKDAENAYYTDGRYANDMNRRAQAVPRGQTPAQMAMRNKHMLSSYRRGALNPQVIAANGGLPGINAIADAEAARAALVEGAKGGNKNAMSPEVAAVWNNMPVDMQRAAIMSQMGADISQFNNVNPGLAPPMPHPPGFVRIQRPEEIKRNHADLAGGVYMPSF